MKNIPKQSLSYATYFSSFNDDPSL